MKEKQTKEGAVRTWRGALMALLSLVFPIVATVGGAFLPKSFTKAFFIPAIVLFALIVAATIAVCVLGKVKEGKFIKEFNETNPNDLFEWMLSHREKAEQSSLEKLETLKVLRRRAALIAVFYGVAGTLMGGLLGIMISSGKMSKSARAVVVYLGCLYAILVCAVAFFRIRFKTPKAVFRDNPSYVKEKDFPMLYSVAKRAAEQLGCGGEIRISLTTQFNAGIAYIGDVISIQLGAVLIAELSEKEIYAVLLHEFKHIAYDKGKSLKEISYGEGLCVNDRQIYGLATVPYAYLDAKYIVEYQAYRFACSLISEFAADRAMLIAGKKEAASVLLKLAYTDYFFWEDEANDHDCFLYKGETPPKNYIEILKGEFDQAKEKRAEFWKGLIKREIISLSATHPTLNMRLEALGISEYETIEIPDYDPLEADRNHAIAFVDDLVAKSMSYDYSDSRRIYYLDPLYNVEKWKKDGEKLTPDGYADLLEDLYSLGRKTEEMQLCDRVIAEFKGSATATAKFRKGMFMLYKFDDGGIDLIYEALYDNSNFVEDGMALIGQYCCMTGNAERLEEYRSRSKEYFKNDYKNENERSKITAKDTLITDDLSKEVHDEIVQKVLEIDKHVTVKRIYIVKKLISQDCYTHAVILERFSGAKTNRKRTYELYHAVFRYLDSKDEQFSLFDFDDVKGAHIKNVENSCIYDRNK